MAAQEKEVKRVIGRPWMPGQSGNPGGRVKGTPLISTSLAKILRTSPEEIYVPQNKADVLALELFDSALKGDTMATREILDRTEGKVSQSLKLSAEQLSTSEITERLLGAFRRAGLDDEQAHRALLQLAAGDDDGS